jgi:CBS domain-containing protein
MKVGEFMGREVVTLGPEDPILEGARLLAKSSARVLPVFNGDGSLVGILTEDAVFFRLEN